MKSIRKLIAVLIFVFAGLPLGLGTLALFATRPLIAGPQVWNRILRDERTESLLRTIEAPTSGSQMVTMGDLELEKKATLQAIQAVLPPRLVVDTLIQNVDNFFTQAAAPAGNTLVVLDLARLRDQLIAESDNAVRIYLENAGELPEEVLTELAGKLPPEQLEAIRRDPANYQDQLGAELRSRLEQIPANRPITLPDEVPAGSVNLETIQSSHFGLTVGMGLTALALISAAAFIKHPYWRERAIQLGSYMIVPGTFVLIIGAIPYLINPAGLLRLPDLPVIMPELVSWLKFTGQILMQPFLVAGGITVAGASALQAFRFLPEREEIEE